MKTLHHTLQNQVEAYHFDSVEGLIEKLLTLPRAHDAVMVKASLSMGFIKIIEALKKRFGEE
jgi:UDP-N-acetylmuramyl pentapeptide synthase